MTTTNSRPSERVSVLATLDPISQSAATVSTGWIDASQHERFLVLVQTGVLGASATLDAKLRQATDSSGTSAKDVSGKAITQIVKASGDNKQAEINLRAEELDTNGGFAYFCLTLTVGTAASLIAATVLGFDAKNGPANAKNQAAVAQIV